MFGVYTLQGTNISPQIGMLKMIFHFPRWDMLIPWRVLAKQNFRAIHKFLQWGWPDQVLLTRCWNGVITPLNSFWRRGTTISNIFFRSAKGFEVLFRAHLLKWIELLRVLLQKIHQTPMGRRWPVEALQICVRRSARLGCPKGVGVGPSLEGMGGPLGWWMFC